MRLFCASLDHETNRHSPIPTGLDSFLQNFLYRPGRGDPAERLAPLWAGPNLLSLCRERGHDCVVGLIAAAHPSAPMRAPLYTELRDELLEDLRQALPVDAVVLRLHGAMMAQDCDDCEGDLLARIRAIVGPGLPVGVLFDLHGNVTPAMVEHASLLIACKEYPHTDFNARAVELLGLLERIHTGDCRPTVAFQRVPMTGVFSTMREPLRGFVDRLMALERDGAALTISATHGFEQSDSSQVGAGVLVTTDDDADAASRLARQLAQEFFALRERIAAPEVDPVEALLRIKGSAEGPWLLADLNDNPGGGAAGDATTLLAALIDADIGPAAAGLLHDPLAVDLCFKAGRGARLPLRLGGKTGPASGAPLDLGVTVTALEPAHWQWAMGARDPLGRAAAVRVGDLDIVLGSVRQQVLSPECFTSLGIDLAACRVVVVKSAQHFEASFAGLSAGTLFVRTPASPAGDTRSGLPRPLWPLDEPPFTAFGQVWPCP